MPPGGKTRALVWAVLAIALAALAGLKHRQNEARAAQIAAVRAFRPSDPAHRVWYHFLRSLAGQPPEAVRRAVDARAPVTWEMPGSNPDGSSGLSFSDYAAGWRFFLQFKDGGLVDSHSSQGAYPRLPPPSLAFVQVEALCRDAFDQALWLAITAMSAAVLLPFLGQKGLSRAKRAWRRTLVEAGLASAALGMAAYWLKPDILAQFRRRGFIADEMLQTYAWLLLAGAVLLWRFRERHERPREPVCDKCGYNLTGNVSGVCPECGAGIERQRGEADPPAAEQHST